MQVFTVDAKYAPEIEAAVIRAIRMIQTDECFRENGKEFITPPNIDESRTGTVTIAIGEDAVAVVAAAFPQEARAQLAIDRFVNAASHPRTLSLVVRRSSHAPATRRAAATAHLLLPARGR